MIMHTCQKIGELIRVILGTITLNIIKIDNFEYI